MKQFFQTMFASALGMCLALGLLLCVFIFSMVAMIAASESEDKVYKPEENAVFRIKLNGGLVDNKVENPFAKLMGNENTSLPLVDLLDAIKKAKSEPNIKGIYLDASFLSGGFANIDALRRALVDFKEEGKFIVSYADFYTQKAYYLCSVADEVFMNPQGALSLSGLSSQAMFYTGLYEKLGVKMEIFKVGTYKGAVEPYFLKKLSDENREQIASYSGSIWKRMTEGIAEARGLTPEDVNRFAEEGLAMAAQQVAVDRKFVDELKYRSEADLYVQSLAGQEGEDEDDDEGLETVGLSKVKNLYCEKEESENEIAILFATGEITQDNGQGSFTIEQTITEDLAKELIKLQKDDDVKAVVLRVNSPGGSAYTSEQIWKQVKVLNSLKPVVVSMGDVAASGGYYISCAASKIVAETNTLTGSIGIFGTFPNATGLFEKIGLTTDIVKTNHFADLGDMSRPMRDDERALIQQTIERGYDTFLSRCAEGRQMSKEQIDAVGQGRVWTGEQAKERGLVDELGGMGKAVELAAELAKLNDYEIEYVSGEKDFFEKLFEEQLGEQMTAFKHSLVKEFLGEELYQQTQQIQRLRTQTGIQARLPYDITAE